MSDRTCSVPDCDRTHYCKGLCQPHYARRQRWGDVQAHKPVIPRLVGIPVCMAEDCGITKIEGFAYCRKHYYRLTRRGSLEQPHRGLAEANPKWIGDAAGYRAVHTRLRKAFGKASTHSCIDCGQQAQDWSYDQADPNEGHDERGCPFSTDLSHYQPRCKKCHTEFDATVFKAWEKRRAHAS